VELFSSLERFLIENKINVEINHLTDALRKAKSVSHLFFRKDGTFPIIGDTELHPSHWTGSESLSKKNGKGIFPDAGFFVYKGNNLYFTARCGGSTFSHRHVDDTSVTLNWDGEDFIVDSGYYNYDVKNDKTSRFFRSCLAHSGVFTNACADVRFANFSSPSDLGQLREISGGSNLWNIEMKSYLDADARICRTVCCRDERRLYINDEVDCKRLTQSRQQFIVHPSCSINISGNTALVSRGDRIVEMHFEAEDSSIIRVEDCAISEKFMKLEKTRRVVVETTAKSASVSATITVRN
jgi:hypothetical protein